MLPGRNVRIVADERIESKEGFKASDQRDTSRQELQQKILEAADFWRDCRAPTEINLRVGAQVWLQATSLRFLTNITLLL